MNLKWWTLAASLVGCTYAANEMEDEIVLENKSRHRQICSGVYSKEDIGGPFDSQIEIDFTGDSNGKVSLIIFAYQDIDRLGVPVEDSNGRQGIKYLCDHDAIDHGLCPESDYGKVIINNYGHEDEEESGADIWSAPITLPSEPVIYNVSTTNYYCVVTFPLEDRFEKYKASVHFMNAYGHLPASQYSLLTFHFVMAVAYTVFAATWGYFFYRYRHDVLPVQKYLTGLAVFMPVEQWLVWGYFVDYNKSGLAGAGHKAYLGIVSVLGAGRLALTLFLLLIVSMGYSVVFPTLGRRLKYAGILAVFQWFAAALYALDSYLMFSEDEEGTLKLLMFLPLSITMVASYIWTLRSLAGTTAYLTERHQQVKARMYRLLWWILIGSALALFLFVLLHTLFTSTQRLKDFINNYWKTKWLLSDGWPNIVYFVSFGLICLIWAPTANNRQYAMSTQLSQDGSYVPDAEEFEIGSLNGSGDEGEEDDLQPPPVNQSGVHRVQTRETMFSADNRDDHDIFSDDENAGGESTDPWNRDEDEDELVQAPGGRLRN
ncbi:hypothetical protein B9G98_01497 [Wickerhamiella sorbophila]|uniref:Membrane protein PTM1 n=1 Tax=Wickerhamiella sorbophila TaxID=45607 RepID=A0A2T0FFY6_9ASCO|nr:hypothetical protein B9G98_01497 [Wickerhamiella sorbophila]PRT53877.1 hypothetical protein B9G98_01497 [Wickerhamiella sorbophila]